MDLRKAAGAISFASAMDSAATPPVAGSGLRTLTIRSLAAPPGHTTWAIASAPTLPAGPLPMR